MDEGAVVLLQHVARGDGVRQILIDVSDMPQAPQPLLRHVLRAQSMKPRATSGETSFNQVATGVAARKLHLQAAPPWS